MNTKRKNNSIKPESLQNLAKLAGIEILHGWRTRLAKFLGVDLALTSKWIKRNQIPNKWLEKITAIGFPPEKWLINNEFDDKTKQEIDEARAYIGKGIAYRPLNSLEEIEAVVKSVRVYRNGGVFMHTDKGHDVPFVKLIEIVAEFND